MDKTGIDRVTARHSALMDLGIACALAEADEAGGLLRDAAALLGIGAMPPSQRQRVEMMLEAHAHDAAALAMVERRAGYMLSYAPGGRHLATVVLARQVHETSAEGASAALALIGALAVALAQAVESPVRKTPAPAPHLRFN
ncbi:MAG: hypothetical protein JSR96_04825 [Proteobacteria bacterium]|nr:hypothetical protein [Pseudomonadota bacterium]